jgi:phosphotransferase system HPr (HPr) family protein
VTVKIPEGLHARPAHALVTLASRFKSDVQVIRNGECADGKSILSILTLAAAEGTNLIIKASGDDAQDALNALESLFLNDFAEDEAEAKTED